VKPAGALQSPARRDFRAGAAEDGDRQDPEIRTEEGRRRDRPAVALQITAIPVLICGVAVILGWHPRIVREPATHGFCSGTFGRLPSVFVVPLTCGRTSPPSKTPGRRTPSRRNAAPHLKSALKDRSLTPGRKGTHFVHQLDPAGPNRYRNDEWSAGDPPAHQVLRDLLAINREEVDLVAEVTAVYYDRRL
jgi:hypothetical protein